MRKSIPFPSSQAVWDDSETILLEQVRDLARRTHWRTYHTLRSPGSEQGFPDLVLLREGSAGVECLIVELKSARGTPTTEQAAWLRDFSLVPGVETAVWRPTDWPQIVERLTRPRLSLPQQGGPSHAPRLA
jgi:hypothetical protein